MEIFRIKERINIASQDAVYILTFVNNVEICIGDILYDLQKNRFRLKTMEMFNRDMKNCQDENLSRRYVFEVLDGTEACGQILVKEPVNVNFLFCNHPLYQRKVDEDYQEEYQAAGISHACALFSYEDLEAGKLSLYGEKIEGLTIYRGWMMRPEMYRRLYAGLEKRGIVLINTPEEYERYHMLPGWYQDFEGITPVSRWTESSSVDDAIRLSDQLVDGAYIVKDYVKSRKHEWYDACFIPDIRDREAVEKVAGNFVRRQGEDLIGGVVFRKFEHLKQIGFHEKSGMPLSEEYRAFIYAGRVLTVSGYWEQDAELQISDGEYAWLETIAKEIKSNFVTIDLARKEDGTLIVMEFGDGQVSGLQMIKAENLYRAFDGEI